MSIGIIDYGIGNTKSISNMLTRVLLPNTIGKTPQELADCEALILPGVGAFGSVMRALKSQGFENFVRDWGQSGKTILGICAGMQILGTGSEEDPDVDGLGLVPAYFRHFPNITDQGTPLRVPHMGWNFVDYDISAPGLENLLPHSRFYFVHSFYASDVPQHIQLMRAQYGTDFTAAFRNENIFGVQFHPEKSHRFGMAFFRSFYSDMVQS